MARLLLLALALGLGFAVRPAAAEVDWSAHASDETIVVVTRDEDGAMRERVIWLLVLDGRPYIRTGGGTTWGENVLRDPNISLKLGGEEVAVRAERVADAGLLGRISAAFREKYGFGDTLAALIRGEPIVFHVTPR